MLAGEVTTLNLRVRTAMRPNEVTGATATGEGCKTQEVPLDPPPLSTRIDQAISIGQPPVCLWHLGHTILPCMPDLMALLINASPVSRPWTLQHPRHLTHAPSPRSAASDARHPSRSRISPPRPARAACLTTSSTDGRDTKRTNHRTRRTSSSLPNRTDWRQRELIKPNAGLASGLHSVLDHNRLSWVGRVCRSVGLVARVFAMAWAGLRPLLRLGL